MKDLIVWWCWWTKLFLLMMWYILGRVLYPIYIHLFVSLDTKIRKSTNRKYKRKLITSKRFPLLVLAGRACVYSNVYNVYGKDLMMLRTSQLCTKNNYANTVISIWNRIRKDIGSYPPHGWPLTCLLTILAIGATVGMCIYGYTNYFLFKKSNNKHKNNTNQINASVYQSLQNESLESRAESFDADSSTIIVDNAANCIIWRDKRNFVPGTYVKLDSSMESGIATAVGSGSPVGIGHLRIGWKDDLGTYREYVIKNVYHVPDSPVNILGISAFSRSLEDYDSKGTRVTSSGKESIFVWDNLQYTKTFSHSEANMPEMTVNEGFSKFHRLCNFLDARCPISAQCYHTYKRNPCEDALVPYNVGEEVLYKRGDHVETAIVDKISFQKDKLSPMVDVRFRDDRKETAHVDNILSSDETDVSIVPTTDKDYAEQTKCLTYNEIQMIKNPQPLSTLQQEWKRLHDKLGHISFSNMDKMVENNLLPKKYAVFKGKSILCPSCIYGRMRKRSWRNKSKSSVKKIRKAHENFPGAKVSIDQLVVAQPGLVPRISGRHTNARVCGATGFIDHHTGYSFSSLQTSLDGEQTLAAKLAFENHADTCDVKIKSYRADNGRFAEKSFRDSVKIARQTIDFCAVGAHHQNGIIERHFQRLSSQSRTILLHAKRHWPVMISVILWPFAYKYAEYLYNHMTIDDKGYSPVQKFCGNVTHSIDLSQIHTWGCPCYVLDSKLQSGTMAPKWDPRSRLGVYLGHSPCHAGSVALVLNPRTLHVSPQFHVAFDDEFATVPYLASSETPPIWNEIVEKSEDVSETDYDLAKLWMSATADPLEHELDQEGDKTRLDTSDSEGVKSSTNPEGVTNKNLSMLLQPTLPDINELSRRRSSRVVKPSEKAKASNDSTVQRLYGLATISISNVMDMQHNMKAFVTHLENTNKLFDDTIVMTNQMIFATISASNDVYTLREMLKLDDIKPFVEAMMKEVHDHESRDHWELFARSDMPSGAKTILSVWAFKLKRFPDGQIMKYKARLNAHGGMQRWGIDYWETYAPVVNWISVRLMLAITIIHKLETKSIDFVLAFPQAELERDVFMELPYGFWYGEKGKYVLRLKKNLYGLADASFNWFQKLCEGLESEGFVKSEIDQCVFIRDDCIILVYVDDMIAISRSNTVLENIVVNLTKKNYILTDEGSLTKYLGVDVQYRSDGGFELTQPFLIKRIVDVLKLDDEDLGRYNTRPTPAVKPLLCKDLLGEKRKHKWNYRQAIGMLTYLQGTTRPDIAMAVHQCARYSINPMLSHEKAVKRVGRYLLGTQGRGIVFQPNVKKGLECYVDADFAGGWAKADAANPDNVLSRTGFVIFYANCPIVWASRMQTEISLSTAESEYIACSTAMRDVLSLIQIMQEIGAIFPIENIKPKMHCTVYEDNESCISMATKRKFSPRTKHIAIKYHHFRKHVNKTIMVNSIDTKEQTADILTKPVETGSFEYLRKKLCGW